MTQYVMTAATILPLPDLIASEGPRSSQVTHIRSMVMVKMTIGNNATDSPDPSPKLCVMILIKIMIKITTVPARFFVAYKKYLYLNQPPCHQHTNATSFDTHGSTKREWYLNKIKAQSQ